MFDRTVSLLKRRDFQSTDPRTLKGLVKRLTMMHEADLPRMRLLPGKVLEVLGRIPRSTEMRENGEPYNVDALEAIERDGEDDHGMAKAITAFFSHRWFQANYSTLHKRDIVWGSAEYPEAMSTPGHYVGKPDNDPMADRAASAPNSSPEENLRRLRVTGEQTQPWHHGRTLLNVWVSRCLPGLVCWSRP